MAGATAQWCCLLAQFDRGWVDSCLRDLIICSLQQLCTVCTSCGMVPAANVSAEWVGSAHRNQFPARSPVSQDTTGDLGGYSLTLWLQQS